MLGRPSNELLSGEVHNDNNDNQRHSESIYLRQGNRVTYAIGIFMVEESHEKNLDPYHYQNSKASEG